MPTARIMLGLPEPDDCRLLRAITLHRLDLRPRRVRVKVDQQLERRAALAGAYVHLLVVSARCHQGRNETACEAERALHAVQTLRPDIRLPHWSRRCDRLISRDGKCSSLR